MNSNLRFDNGDQTVGLADGGIAGQNVGVLQDGLVGRCVLADLEDASPLGELASIFFVLGAASVQIVQTFATTTPNVNSRGTYVGDCI
jgi:hypothetical protein